jgi:gamma-glutamyltranspeptidase/glutathione hydrolase
MTLLKTLFLLLLLASLAGAQVNQVGAPMPVQGRSVVATKFGIVATSQPLASMAGVQILERGGNAVDAAIAANSTLGLMEPTSNGIGGDLFAIIYDAKSEKLYGLNSSGWSAKAQTPELLALKGIKEMPERGVYSATVPGAGAGWDEMRQRFGSCHSRLCWLRRSTTPKTGSR